MRGRLHIRPSLALADSFADVAAADPMAGVNSDATSGEYFPSTAGQWDIALAAAGITSGGPSALWLCQEASGNLADSIGSFTLTAAATPNYQQTITGYTRKGIVLDDNTADAFTSADAALPDIASESILILGMIRTPGSAPAANRAVIAVGGAGTRFSTFITSTPRLRATHVSNNADTAGSPCDGAVHAFALRHNDTGSEADCFLDTEKLSPTWGATSSGKGILIGSGGATAAACGYLYLAMFRSTAAELSDAQIPTLFATLGWA